MRRPPLLAQIVLLAATGAASAATKGTCEKEWDQLQGDSRFATVPAKIKQFEGYASSCAGSGLYEVQLSRLYMREKDFAKAEDLLDNALKQNMPHRKEILFQEGIIYGADQDLVRAEATYKILIRDYPDSHEGYSGLGDVLLAQRRAKESIEQYERAIALQPSSTTYRNLVLAYVQERRFSDAIGAFDKYYRLDNGAFGDRDAVMSAALAYAKQGELELADGALRGLLKARPGVKDDVAFVNLFRKVNEALLAKKG
jgi:tetratricopeptide (TPR) repeat protein